MNHTYVSELWQKLTADLTEKRIRSHLAKGYGDIQLGDTLQVLLPMPDADGSVSLMEIAVIDYMDDVCLLAFNTTLIMGIGPGLQQLREETEHWNLSCTLGAFGVYAGERQYYHKYCYPFHKDSSVDDMEETAMYLIELLCNVISGYYGDAVRISGHE